MIFLLLYLAWAALLLALPVTWILGSLYAGKLVRRLRGPLLLARAFPVFLVTAPIAWVTYGWFLFNESCSTIPPLAVYSQPPPQRSVLLRWSLADKLGGKDTNIDIRSILEQTGPVCIEHEFWGPITDPQSGKTSRYAHQCGPNYERTVSPISAYAFSIDATPDSAGLGFKLTYRAEDVNRTTVAAEAHEAILGRGVLSQYIGLLAGSGNREYLACGYADQSVRIWRRPSASNTAYMANDLRLFQVAAGQANAR